MSQSHFPFYKIQKYWQLDRVNLTAKCLICPPDKPVFSFSKTSYSNLTKHTSKQHEQQMAEAAEDNRKPAPQSLLKDSWAKVETSTKVQKLDDALLKFIVMDNLPLSTVETNHFRAMMKIACPEWNPPTRQTLRKRIIETAPSIEFDRDYVVKYGKPCFTADLWTSRATKGFLGITAHFVTTSSETTYTLQRKLAGVREFPPPHTGERIRQL
jgi:hypothetical protein